MSINEALTAVVEGERVLHLFYIKNYRLLYHLGRKLKIMVQWVVVALLVVEVLMVRACVRVCEGAFIQS